MRRNILLRLVILLFTSMILFKVSSAYVSQKSSVQMIYENENYISEPKSITCYTKNHINDNTYLSGFSYSDELFFHNADSENVEPDYDIAKVCASLMSAAYYEDSITDVLKNEMKYDVVTTYDYERNATYTDNDFVAFSVAKKKVIKEGKTYCLYIVVVRGTPGSGEWYSNFRLGKNNGGNHEGFYKAAGEVLNVLEKEWFDNDEADDRDCRKIIITGHSRGAAVANIVAGKLSDSTKYARKDSIFGYTYACPSVSKNANEAYTNIYNFNNNSDIITALPLETWGYKRYGKTLSLNTTDIQFDNFKQRFYSETGHEYNGTKSGNVDTFIATLSDFVVSETAYNSEEAQLAFDLVAYALGGKKDTQFQPAEFFAKHGIFFSEITLKKLSSNVYGLFEDLKKINNENTSLEGEISDALTETSGIGEDEWISWKNSNYLLTDKISEITNIIINKRSDLFLAYSQIAAENTKIGKIGAIFTDVILLFVDSSGNPKDAIWHGHAAITYELWINSMYFGYEGWENNDMIDHIAITNCRYVGEYCFYNCDGLTELVIPDTVINIGGRAFTYCNSLKEIKIPDSVEYMGTRAFAECNSLKKVTMPVDLKYVQYTRYNAGVLCGSFGYDSNIEEIIYTKGKTGILRDNTDPSYYDDNTYNNHEGAITYECRGSLKKVTIEEGVTYIGDYAFYWNYALEDIEIPSTVTSIGYKAFYDCLIPKSINLKNVENLGEYSFSGSSLTGIYLSEKLKEIPKYCFSSCNSLTEVKIPDSVEYVGTRAFAYCYSLTKVTMPVDLQYVQYTPYNASSPYSSFGWDSIEELTYTKGKTGILRDNTDPSYYDDNTYNNHEGAITYECRGSLKKVTIEEGVTYIGDYAFYWNYALEDIEIPSTVTSIGYKAFYDCLIPKSINLKNVENLGEYSFSGSSLTGIYLSEKLKEIPKYCFSSCNSLTEVKIPDSVEYVGTRAFAYCYNLTKITMTVDLKYSHKYSPSSFYDVSVEEIVYTKGKTGIMPDKDDNSDEADYHGSIEYQSSSTLKKVTFSEEVTQIGDLAFYGVSDGVKIQFPKSINKISTSAFSNTWTSVTIFYGYEDTVIQSYTTATNVSFVPLEKPIINNNISQTERGKTIQFTAQVCTGIDNYTDNVTWSIENAEDSSTNISDSGLLYVSDREKSNIIKVCASYGTTKTTKEIKVIIPIYNVTFTGAVNKVVKSSEKGMLDRPIECENEGYDYTYYWNEKSDENQIKDDEWPVDILTDQVIYVERSLKYAVSVTVNGNTLYYDSLDEALAEIAENAIITIYTDQNISCSENEQNREIILPENVIISSKNDAVLTIERGVNVSGGNYELNVVNNGVINSAEINKAIKNNYIVSDCVIEKEGVIFGGKVSGNIYSEGELKDVMVMENGVVEGGILTGNIQNNGIIRNVNSDNANVSGNEIEGTVTPTDTPFIIPDGVNKEDVARLIELIDGQESLGAEIGYDLTDEDAYGWDYNGNLAWIDWRSKNLKGSLTINGFANLDSLYLEDNNLDKICVTDCAALESLDCSDNNLTELDVSGCTKLVSLNCMDNKLTKLDLSNCPEIFEKEDNLFCDDNVEVIKPDLGNIDSDEEPTETPTEKPEQKPDESQAPTRTPITPSTGFGNTQSNVSTDVPPVDNTNINTQPPAAAKILSSKNTKKGKVVIKWNKSADISGCEIQYSNNRKFKKAKKKSTSKNKYIINKLKKKKVYYIRLRAYKVVNGAKLYGSWSKPKKIKIRK